MNKKIYAGIFAFGIAASFWACGSGEIMKPMSEDNTMANLDDAVFSLLSTQPSLCPQCGVPAETSSSSSSRRAVTPRSSSSQITTPQSSSSIIIISAASSSGTTFPPMISSSSQQTGPTVSSSSTTIAPPINDVGTCAPDKETVELNDKVTWTYTRGTGIAATAILSATCDWTSADGDPISGSGKCTKTLKYQTAYSTSGKHAASIKVNLEDGSSHVVQCSPVQVNGDPIKGCTCSTEAAAVDYTNPLTPGATWSVTGCLTGATRTLSYEWDGAPGEANFTKVFEAATPSYAPVLKVSNDDNTTISVTCPAIKVTEGPEYTIKDNSETGKVTFPAAGTYNVVIAYACQNKQFYCNGTSGPVGGSVNGATLEKSWYTTANLSAEDCSGSATVVVEIDGAATCGAQ